MAVLNNTGGNNDNTQTGQVNQVGTNGSVNTGGNNELSDSTEVNVVGNDSASIGDT